MREKDSVLADQFEFGQTELFRVFVLFPLFPKRRPPQFAISNAVLYNLFIKNGQVEFFFLFGQ